MDFWTTFKGSNQRKHIKNHLLNVVANQLNRHISEIVNWYAEHNYLISINLNASLITNNELRYRCCVNISRKMVRIYFIWGKQKDSHENQVQCVQKYLQWKRANGFGKGQRNFQHTQIHYGTKSLEIKHNGQPIVTFCWLYRLLLPIMKLW